MSKEDVLNAVRYRVEDGKGRHLYCTICLDPKIGTPYEIWVTVPEENKAPEQAVRTSATMICALFSEARQNGVSYTKLLRTIESVIYDKSSVPARIYRLLLMHCPIDKAEELEFEHDNPNASQNRKECEECHVAAAK